MFPSGGFVPLQGVELFVPLLGGVFVVGEEHGEGGVVCGVCQVEMAIAGIDTGPTGCGILIEDYLVQCRFPFGEGGGIEGVVHGTFRIKGFGCPSAFCNEGTVDLHLVRTLLCDAGIELWQDLGGLCGKLFHLAAVGQGDDNTAPIVVGAEVLLRDAHEVALHHGFQDFVVGRALGMDFGGAAYDVVRHVAQFVGHLHALHGTGVEEDELRVREVFEHAPEGGDVHLQTAVAGGVLPVVYADGAGLGNPSAAVGPEDVAVLPGGELGGDFLQGPQHHGAVRADLVLLVGLPFGEAFLGGHVVDSGQGAIVEIHNQVRVGGNLPVGLFDFVQVVCGKAVEGVLGHHVQHDGALGLFRLVRFGQIIVTGVQYAGGKQ